MATDSETDSDILWQVVVRGSLPMHAWDGDYVVYNPLSGATHVLDVASGQVLAAVINDRMSARDICRHLANFLDVQDDQGMARTVAGLIAHLDELGLIEPAGEC